MLSALKPMWVLSSDKSYSGVIFAQLWYRAPDIRATNRIVVVPDLRAFRNTMRSMDFERIKKSSIFPGDKSIIEIWGQNEKTNHGFSQSKKE